MSARRHPRIGVGVVLRAPDGSIAVGVRRGSHGAGQLALPGGALEWTESIAACASRETLEECGLVVPERDWVVPFAVSEAVIDEDNHWITVFALVDVAAGTPLENREPHKCEGWRFIHPNDIRADYGREKPAGELFLPLRLLLDDARAGL